MRRTALIAAACAGLLVVTYLLSTHTSAGQRLEDAALRGSSSGHWRLAAGALKAITPWSVTLAVLGVGALGWRRGGPWLGFGAAALILVSIGTADLLQHVLPRPPLLHAGGQNPGRSFPSGHAAVGISVTCALLVIVPYRFRYAAALPASVAMSAAAALTVIARWHRPSDTAGSALIVLIYACIVTPILTRRGHIAVASAPTSAQLRVRALVVAALGTQVMVAGTVAGVSVIRYLAVTADPQQASDPAFMGGLAITIAVGGTTALVMLALASSARSARPGRTASARRV